MEQTLELFSSRFCPFCIKVESFLTTHSITIPITYTDDDPTHKQRLQGLGGKTQVPCLVINGNAMYESDSIIEWFQEHHVS